MMRRSRRSPVPRALGIVAALALVVVGIWALTRVGGPERARAEEQPVGSTQPESPDSNAARNETPAQTRTRPSDSNRGSGASRETTPARPLATGEPRTTLPRPSEQRREPTEGPAPARDPATTRAPVVEPASKPDAASGATPEKAAGSVPADVRSALLRAEQRIASEDLLGARLLLTTALRDPRTPRVELDAIRARIGQINDELIFSPRIFPGEALTESYEVQSGDSLTRIASRMGLATDWRLIQRVNRISDPSRIRVGQSLKLVRGPFHAIVDKSDYRLDLYAGDPGNESNWQFIKSFPVGLGEGDSTPTGEFVVRDDSKLVNPYWVNPRTGEKFAADDPENPIGERWIGLEGVGEYAVLEGYGLHGTIEPESIGSQRSMGCVRLDADDIALVYECLVEEVSRVSVVP